METDNNSSSTTAAAVPSSFENYILHLSNIQLLASIDCALALITLVFNLRQVALAIDDFPKESRLDEYRAIDDDDVNADGTGSHIRIVAEAVGSVCLTLTQLLLACLVMVFLSNSEQGRTVQSSTRIVAGVWVLWSSILLILCIVYSSRIKGFDDFGDKFYLFAMICEIILRIGIISYTSVFFVCQCFYHH